MDVVSIMKMGNSRSRSSACRKDARKAAKVFLMIGVNDLARKKQGRNDVLIKAPVVSFKGKDWQIPVKWMFTFVQIPFD